MTKKQDFFTIMGGKVRILCGPYNPTSDAVWLAAFVDGAPKTVLDVGTGTGAVALCIMARIPGTSMTAIDISPEMLAAAETEAANQIRLDFTINAIADAEKIEVSQEELLQTINQFAMMQGMKLDEMIRKLQKEGRIMTMMHSIRMQKTLEAIVKLADVTEIA